jgi:prophage DNA circulation protein
MKNDEIVFSEEMKLELGESLAALGSGQVKLQRLLAQQDAKIAQQDAMIGTLTDQVATLVKLVDGHQRAIQLLQAGRRGIVN